MIILFLFITLYRLCWATSSEEFYILPMGQGNAQLIIYNADQSNQRIGFLYDMGSKSLQTHPKFTMKSDRDIRFKPKDETELNINEEDKEEVLALPEQLATTPDGKNVGRFFDTPGTTEQKVDSPQMRYVRKGLHDFIKKLLMDLKHLFIFVSHTDIDHINKFDDSAIPLDFPVTVFLCGDWFGDMCSKSSVGEDPSTAVKNTLEFFLKRSNTNIEFPYYWGFKVGIKNFNTLVKEKFSATNSIEIIFQDLANLVSKLNYNAPCPKFFSGHLSQMITFRNNLEGNELTLDNDFKQAIDNLYIWSINLPTSDVNDFSPIISCTLPSMNLSVVLTGDAGVPVFQSISMNISSGQDFRQILEKDVNHLVLLMLPHHGSYLNVGGVMLNFFKPSVFGVAAGDGGQHGHPSLKSIEWIKEIYKQEILDKNFYKLYKQESKYQIIAIYTPFDRATYKHKIVSMHEDSPMFLCPNIYGCIKWNKNGIYTNFNNLLILNDKEYYVDYTSHVLEREGNIPDQTLKSSLLFKYSYSDKSPQSIKLHYIEKLKNEFFPYKYLLQGKDGLYIGMDINGSTFVYKLFGSKKRIKRTRSIDE